jgi:hypothetical protein
MDRLDTKLTKFEESEIDERKQLEVRVSAIEKHFGLDKKIAADQHRLLRRHRPNRPHLYLHPHGHSKGGRFACGQLR